jgi:hypothetical protein
MGSNKFAAAPAGVVTLSLANTGSEPHAAQLYHLNDGVTVERFTRGMEAGSLQSRRWQLWLADRQMLILGKPALK